MVNDVRDSKSDLIEQFHEIVHIVNLVGEYRELLEDIDGFRDKIELPMKEFYEGVLVWTLHCFNCLPRARGSFPRKIVVKILVSMCIPANWYNRPTPKWSEKVSTIGKDRRRKFREH